LVALTGTDPHDARESVATFLVGDWYVEPAAGQITRGDRRVRLEPRVMDVLAYLAARPGQVVSRESLEASVWAGMVVGYEALTNTMQKLRKALGDDSRQPRYIETVSKRGYRLIAEVRAPVEAAAVPRDTSTRAPRSRLIAVLLVVLLLIGIAAWYLMAEHGETIAPATDVADAPVPVAVLPFDNISGDPEQQYFAAGITSDLVTELSGVEQLAVISEDSTTLYRDASLEHIGRELGVRYVLKGNVRRDGTKVRLNAQLVETQTGRHLWAKRFDATLEDTFAVQDDITRQIAGVLQVHFNADRRSLIDRYVPGIAAYDVFLRGLDHYGRRSFDDLELAASYYRQAMELDPRFARAYANLGLVHLRHAIDGWEIDPRGSLDEARELAQQALRLNDQLAEIHFVNAFVDLFRREYEDSIHGLEQALKLRPSYADAYAMLAWVLQFAGRPEQAAPNLQRAIQLNPYTPASYLLVQGEGQFQVGDYSGAIRSLERALEKNPVNPRAQIVLAAAYAQADRLDDANWIVESLLAEHPTLTRARLQDAFPYRDELLWHSLHEGLRKAGVPE